MPGQPAGRLQCGRDGDLRPRQLLLTFLRNAWRPCQTLEYWASGPTLPFPCSSAALWASPLFQLPSCLSESWIGSHALLAIDSCRRAARPGYRCRPFEKPPSLLVFWALQEPCHRSTPAASDWSSPTTMPPVFISQRAQLAHPPRRLWRLVEAGLWAGATTMPLVTAAPVGVGDTASSPPFLGGL